MPGSSIDAAFEYAFPLFAVAQTRYRAVQDTTNPRRHAPNTLQHERHLSDHTSRWITAPNNDTVYSNAWLDLSRGPVRICVGAQPDGRYWSLAFMDAFTNHFAVIGQREQGSGPVDVTIAGPDQTGAAPSEQVIRAPGNDAWLFVRCLVDGPEDLPAAHAMQNRIEVVPPPGAMGSPRVVPVDSRDPQNFLAVVNEALAHNPAPQADAALLDKFGAVGLRLGSRDAWHDIGPEVRAAWAAMIGPAHDKLRQASATGRREMQGWFASAADMGDFGQNHRLRASVALGGLGALPPAEAMYFVRFHDDATQPLDGRNRYLLRVPPEGIPTGSFWSFSMYEPTADAQRFFVDNPIDRYSIGNRTQGLRYNDDGSLDITLQHDAPADPGWLANWLPAPAGPFQISLRAYMPQASLQGGGARMPEIVRA